MPTQYRRSLAAKHPARTPGDDIPPPLWENIQDTPFGPIHTAFDLTSLERLVWGVVGALVVVMLTGMGYWLDHPTGAADAVYAANAAERHADMLALGAQEQRQQQQQLQQAATAAKASEQAGLLAQHTVGCPR